MILATIASPKGRLILITQNTSDSRRKRDRARLQRGKMYLKTIWRNLRFNDVIMALMVGLLCYIWYDIIQSFNCGMLMVKPKYPSSDYWKRMKSNITSEADRYWILKNFIQSEISLSNTDTSEMVTLVTETAPSNLKNVLKLSNIWNGPISVAVLIREGDAELAVKKMLTYNQEIDQIKKFVSFHLVIEKFNISEENNKFGSQLYPTNIMRNVALSSINAGYVFVIDIHMMPSTNLHNLFINFSKTEDRIRTYRTAYIVPVFELSVEEYIPDNRAELVELFREGHVLPLSSRKCRLCQIDTNYEKWLSEKYDLVHSYKIRPTSSLYEPFYILNAKIYPNFDEKFNHCKSRFTQVCETYLSGVDFEVLTNVYLIRKGFHSSSNCSSTPKLNSFRNKKMKKYQHLGLKRTCF